MVSYLLLWVQGEAHLLLEAYKAAETAFLAGLGIDPTDQALTDGLKLTHKAISEADKAEANPHKRSAGLGTPCLARSCQQPRTEKNLSEKHHVYTVHACAFALHVNKSVEAPCCTASGGARVYASVDLIAKCIGTQCPLC